MEFSEIFKFLPVAALIGLVWGITAFFLKRKYEKSDKQRAQKIQILTDYLLKLNELRAVLHKVQNEISKGNQTLRKTLHQYWNQYDGIFNDETQNNKQLKELRFWELADAEKIKFFEESDIYFIENKKILENIKMNLTSLSSEIEKKGLDVKKDALINIHANKEIFQGQVNLLKWLNKFTDNSVIIGEDIYEDIKTYLPILKAITEECYKLEYAVMVELRKVSIY